MLLQVDGHIDGIPEAATDSAAEEVKARTEIGDDSGGECCEDRNTGAGSAALEAEAVVKIGALAAEEHRKNMRSGRLLRFRVV